MVWRKLFGLEGSKSPAPARPPEPTAAEAAVDRWLASLDPMWRDAVVAIQLDPNLAFELKDMIYRPLREGRIDEARENIRRFMPQFTEATRQALKHAGQAPHWSTIDQMAKAGIVIGKSAAFPMDALQLAYLPVEGRDDLTIQLWFQQQGHLLTVAPTGAGKGQRFILRTLLDFEGPVVVLDPKGENYRETAWRRNLYGQVFKWAPSEADSDCYNPLDRVKTWDDARLLSELLIVPQSKEPFWDNAAKDLLTGLIYYVINARPPERRNMREVCRLLAGGKADHAAMIESLQAADDERLRELGNVIETQSEQLRASIYTTLRTQLEVWRSEGVVATTSASTPGWSVEDILVRDNISVTFAAKEGRAPGWHQREDGGVSRGSAASVYLVVPPDKIGSMRSVLRVLLGQHLSEAIRVRKMLDDDNAQDDNLPKGYLDWPMMFYFDELPQLGYMRLIEEAVAITRSYRIRLWLFTQDMAQLKEVYPQWESLLANCRCQIYFRPNDLGTAEHVALRLGRRKDIWGGEDWVASPQQLMGTDFRDECVIFQDGLSIRARMFAPLYADPHLQGWVKQKKADFGDTVQRAPRPSLPPPPPEPDEPAPEAPDADLADNAEYQQRLAALQAEIRAKRKPDPPASKPGTIKPPGFDD